MWHFARNNRKQAILKCLAYHSWMHYECLKVRVCADIFMYVSCHITRQYFRLAMQYYLGPPRMRCLTFSPLPHVHER